MNVTLSDSAVAQQWIELFDPEDQALAARLIDSLVIVSGDNFKNDIQDQIVQWADDVNGPVGLYVEREGLPHALFSEPVSPPKHASGPGPVRLTAETDVGSEGIVGQLVSELCRSAPGQFFDHPGPDQIRANRVRAFLLVTDFIGSGDRACEYLTSAWRVRSVRSWSSLHRLSLGVIAYSATKTGAGKVRRHASRPKLALVRACPTIYTEFSKPESRLMRSLCEKYDPLPTPFLPALGWGDVGALITFSHGIPDNAPKLLWHDGNPGRRWVPLFPGRATVGRREYIGQATTTENIVRRLVALRQYRLSLSPALRQATCDSQEALLVLAALAGRGAKTEEAISGKTGLNVLEIRKYLFRANANGFVDKELRLTDAGQRELAYFRRNLPVKDSSVESNPVLYYPKALRSPAKSS